MNTDTDNLADRIARLENQTKRLHRAVFLIWPAVWIVSLVVLFTTTKLDAASTRLLLDTLGSLIVGLVLVGGPVVALLFIIRTASDYKNQRSRFTPNPGSRLKP